MTAESGPDWADMTDYPAVVRHLEDQIAMLESDVLTAWRVRNAALTVAASFVHPGPDGEDYLARDRLVREWVEEGHEEVAAKDAEHLALQMEVIRLRHLIDGLPEGSFGGAEWAATPHLIDGSGDG